MVIHDRLKETSTIVGTGVATLTGLVTGYRSLADIGDGNETEYMIIAVDGDGVPTGEWESGVGTYTLSGTTLSRDTVLRNSLGTQALLSFAAGTKHVVVGPLSSDARTVGCKVKLEVAGFAVLNATTTLVDFDGTNKPKDTDDIFIGSLYTSLEAYYKFNVTVGKLLDSTSNSLDLTQNGSYIGGSGKFDDGYNNDGTATNFLYRGADDAPLDFSGGSAVYAISLWLNADDLTGDIVPIAKGTGGSAGWILKVKADGAVDWICTGTSHATAAGVITTTAGWQHITISSNGTNVRIRVDGVEEFNATRVTIGASTEVLRVANAFANANPLDGTVDEIGFWSRELTDAEADSIYFRGVGRGLEPSRFYIPPGLGGTYVFTAEVSYPANATGYRTLNAVHRDKAGVTKDAESSHRPTLGAATTHLHRLVMIVFDAVPGDWIEITTYQNSTITLTLVGSAAATSAETQVALVRAAL